MNSLDELYDHDGSYPLDERNSIFHFCEQVNVLHHMRGFPIIQHWISYYFKERITVIYDLGRGFILLQRTNLDLLDEISQSGLVSENRLLYSISCGKKYITISSGWKNFWNSSQQIFHGHTDTL